MRCRFKQEKNTFRNVYGMPVGVRKYLWRHLCVCWLSGPVRKSVRETKINTQTLVQELGRRRRRLLLGALGDFCAMDAFLLADR